MLRTMIDLEPASKQPPSPDINLPLTAPAKALHRTYPAAPVQDHPAVELPNINPSGAATPFNEQDDLESSPSGSPIRSAVDAMNSVWDPYMNRFRMASCCLCLLVDGLSDSAAGALIPYMETYYNIGYGTVSLIFVGQAVGFIIAAMVLDTLRAKLGRAKLLGLSQACMALGYALVVAPIPFIMVIFALVLVGFGLAINNAVGITFLGSLQNGTLLMGIMHGTYGIGGISGPLAATALVTVANTIWSRYYIITLGVSVLSLIMAVWSFWHFEKEQDPATRAKESNAGGRFLVDILATLRLRVVLLGAIFIFAYQGAEVSISGWVISFLITYRGGDPSSVGYVSSGFWAGITVGRFLLSGPAQRVGEKRFVYGLVIGAIAFQFLVWFVPNVIGNAVAVSIVGLLLGPIYPCSSAVFIRNMPHSDVLRGMGTISASGSLGGAVAPFLTGMLAQAKGTYVLHPVVIAMLMVMLLCWYGLPLEEKRTE